MFLLNRHVRAVSSRCSSSFGPSRMGAVWPSEVKGRAGINHCPKKKNTHTSYSSSANDDRSNDHLCRLAATTVLSVPQTVHSVFVCLPILLFCLDAYVCSSHIDMLAKAPYPPSWQYFPVYFPSSPYATLPVDVCPRAISFGSLATPKKAGYILIFHKVVCFVPRPCSHFIFASLHFALTTFPKGEAFSQSKHRISMDTSSLITFFYISTRLPFISKKKETGGRTIYPCLCSGR